MLPILVNFLSTPRYALNFCWCEEMQICTALFRGFLCVPSKPCRQAARPRARVWNIPALLRYGKFHEAKLPNQGSLHVQPTILSSGASEFHTQHVPVPALEECGWWLRRQKPTWGWGRPRNTCLPLFFRSPKGGEVLRTEDTMSHFGLHFPIGTWALMSLFSLVHSLNDGVFLTICPGLQGTP